MSNDELTNILSVVLAGMIGILVLLIIIYVVIKIKTREPKKKEKDISSISSIPKEPAKKDNIEYNKQSIFTFMDFDKIEDNMIVRKNGKRFLMVIECQGVNYDLMSGLEKNGVEQGFAQFLNTLRYPIQLYIQTRTVNLESGIMKYKDRVEEIKNRLSRKQMELYRKQEMGYTLEEINKARLEVTREMNLYEYGLDIVNNTEKMSLNRNILRKHYYVIIEFMPEDITNLVKEEISSMAFSELYTKAQTIINSLSVCGIKSKVLNSEELAELLYIAYNRDESETYNLNKAINSGYDELYRTAPDVLSKRMKEIDKKIEQDGKQLANDTVMEVMLEAEKTQRVKEKEEEMDELIREMAKIVLRENETYIGKDVAQKAMNKIDANKTNKPKKKTAKDKEVNNEKK